MHDFDSYTLYEIKKVPYYVVRIQVILTELVRGEILRSAAERAWQRFPYFSRSVAVDAQGVYTLEPCPKPVTVTPDDHAVRLGTPETNDLLFAVTNLARHLKCDAESAVEGTTTKFARRFRAVEAAAKAQGRDLKSMTLAEMDALWEAAKQSEHDD